jgi:arylsulfatase A-like enzyme
MAAVAKAVSGPKTIVLIVEDTVRADHLSVCGYERPTSSHLATWVERGAVFSCDAYSPGTWTLPSHASFFTGRHVLEHHVLNKGFALEPSHETLAEYFAARGYRTALVSANPTLTQASGVWQGFHHVAVARGLYSAWRGRDLGARLREVLSNFDPSEPLFLVVNIFDAHDPYPAVPQGISWLPPRTSIELNPANAGPRSSVHRFLHGEMNEAQQMSFLAHVQDTYDWGVFQADRNLASVMKQLREDRWLDDGFRLVVTSDHGEHLGEHQMIRHDGPPWEGVVRVPVLFYDDTLEKMPSLPSPMSAISVYDLLKDGTLGTNAREVAAASIAYRPDGKTRKDSVALWRSRQDKLMWLDGAMLHFNPDVDPLEAQPLPADGHPSLGRLAEHVEMLDTSKSKAVGRGVEPEVLDMLKAVGYIE